MKIMTCPLVGPRNIQEFIYGGEVKDVPDPRRCSESEWANFLFFEDNRKGLQLEWWCHAPTNYWFIVERDTEFDEIVRTIEAADVFRKRRDIAGSN